MNRHLVFRCAICRATTSLQAEWTDERAVEVSCSSCHALFELDARRDRAESDQAYLEQVRRYAVENRIDLASAYSVVEGIIPREKIRTLPAGSAEIPRGGVKAVRSLALLALLILSLGFLARQIPSIAPGLAAPGDGSGEALVTGTDHVKLVPISYQLDGEGSLTQVTAADPRAALVAFCQHETNARTLRALSIAPDAGAAELRIGVMRDADHPGTFAWVSIRRDTRTGRWTIGDGVAPVQLERDRSLPPGAELLIF